MATRPDWLLRSLLFAPGNHPRKVAKIGSFGADAIVLDLNLAGENGLLLMEFLKQKHPGVPILVYTGMANDSSTIQGIIKQGAQKYLRKGSMAELCDTIKSMVN